VFPNSEKTGDNIKSWLLQVLIDHQIKHSMASGSERLDVGLGACGPRWSGEGVRRGKKVGYGIIDGGEYPKERGRDDSRVE
jgi:hypothetical protein